MHVENELVEIMTTDDHEFEEIVEEYEEEILVQEVPEPSLTDSADTAPTQGKPRRCITPILNKHWIYIYVCVCVMCNYVIGILWKPPA